MPEEGRLALARQVNDGRVGVVADDRGAGLELRVEVTKTESVLSIAAPTHITCGRGCLPR
eukprot:scaffold90421_cov30-Tisochrysis_lutea.AAC.2